ncbi:MAG TPA: sigma-70 family RNA polymerase sigma factor [Vicinamibacterales bacterium]|nr:sigma-70 family RNA polymerase sigma factor [Vicinamibacterales bacterium]
MAGRRFEDAVMPHLDAAFNYARWLTRNDVDAEDLVQEACMRAMRFLASLRDGNPRPWLFAIVRNTWYSRQSRPGMAVEHPMDMQSRDDRPDDALDPEQQLAQQDTVARVRRALEALPAEFREAVVLRDIEGLSYKEIAEALRVPIGTVMSRISRGRERLLETLSVQSAPEVML